MTNHTSFWDWQFYASQARQSAVVLAKTAPRGLGAMIEVVEPRSVQAELARIGTELASRYASAHLM